MPNDVANPGASPSVETVGQSRRILTPAAERALQEAAERRAGQEALQQRETTAAAPELGGRNGPDPVRYGDWENGGIVSDF